MSARTDFDPHIETSRGDVTGPWAEGMVTLCNDRVFSGNAMLTVAKWEFGRNGDNSQNKQEVAHEKPYGCRELVSFVGSTQLPADGCATRAAAVEA